MSCKNRTLCVCQSSLMEIFRIYHFTLPSTKSIELIYSYKILTFIRNIMAILYRWSMTCSNIDSHAECGYTTFLSLFRSFFGNRKQRHADRCWSVFDHANMCKKQILMIKNGTVIYRNDDAFRKFSFDAKCSYSHVQFQF